MLTVPLPRIGTWEAWRDAARRLLAAGVPPREVLWDFDGSDADLFASDDRLPDPDRQITVPKSFLSLAQNAVWHGDPERFARLYAFLWRVVEEPHLMADRADPDLARLRAMEKNVNRCKHKMKAFVRFRDLQTGGNRRAFAAWFEPTHHTVEPTAPFFARRFADMDWMIVTPDVTAKFEGGAVSFLPGQPKPDLPEDAAEELWGTYFCNIFNPARVKISAMTSEMPKKYWKNMPETRHIPALIAGAEAKVREMQAKAPTLPPERMAHIREQLLARPQPASWNMLDAGLRGCVQCPLHAPATQVVPGQGPRDAEIMIVGEQPGDQEDLAGVPFVGPAGQLFDALATESGLDRGLAYVTNAVKHFKFEPRGKRRIHKTPHKTEVHACRNWLQTEIRLVQPKLIVALGATALAALTGDGKDLLKRRGGIEDHDGTPVFVTVHPSFLLRLPVAEQAKAKAEFVRDLRMARDYLAVAHKA
ncbi:DNA polymerase [Cognatiyoonia koreensis]|uniref:Type-4 uracil-DNA glycosylase n=1 Tax=Cognatiyoonia koreensis TaxID=364200 RepID=A0A1I0MHA7_9RHOB|nr:UdgX family uracil-DNA binding protein [Cognatiyoonia koreensis]SEV87699.1 DNA polymerase [Cognatiyoonia koreensis]